ncbi:hypothetical protein ACFL6I_07965 [candidate division KSB1 bacterium]
MKKRGYFFTLDVSIAMIIVVVGFLLIWSFYITETKKEQPYFYAQDVIDVLSSTQIAGVAGTNNYIQQLVMDGNITHFDNTILEEIALLYMRESVLSCMWAGCKPHLAENLTRSVVGEIVPNQYSLEVIINNERLYWLNSSAGTLQDDSDILISAKKMVVVVHNKVNLSEPYLAEVRVWR